MTDEVAESQIRELGAEAAANYRLRSMSSGGLINGNWEKVWMHLRDSVGLQFSSRIVNGSDVFIKSHKVTTLSRFQVDTLAESSIQLYFQLFHPFSNFA